MKPLHILLAEDNLADVRLTQVALNNGHLDTILQVVHDGAEALAYLFKTGKFTHALTPDLVILDIHMPKKSGIEVLREIKADAILKDIPVIILTTSGNEHDIKNTFEDNANCYIVKPFDFNQFMAAIDIFSIDLLSGSKAR
jgi:two-component system response regulator